MLLHHLPSGWQANLRAFIGHNGNPRHARKDVSIAVDVVKQVLARSARFFQQNDQ
jgi:hypothetical protein